ncbi:NAD(P)-binding protein [Amylocystis lapponica]|nr:NAD(P)-binding protein [Amylocystis lapponica]
MAVPPTTREWHLPKAEGFRSLALRETSVRPPKSYEVLLKVHAVSLQYRDIAIAKGLYRDGLKEDPVLCSDMAGEIVAVGEDVKGWNVGDRVFPNGTVNHLYGDITSQTVQSALGGQIDGVLADYKLIPAHCLVRIPAHLSYEEASTLPCAGLTAYLALNGPVPVKGGDTVLVQGTGGVAIFGLQIAVASGATVIVISSSDEKLKIAGQVGAKHLINYRKTPHWAEDVLKITNGRGVDHVMEIGGPSTLMESIAAVRYGGWVHEIGFLSGAGDVSAVPFALHAKSACLRGIIAGALSQFENLVRLVAAHSLKPVVDKVFAFEEAVAALEYMDSQQHVGKVVIRVSKS